MTRFSILAAALMLGGCITTSPNNGAGNASVSYDPTDSVESRTEPNYSSPCLTLTNQLPRGFYRGLGSAETLPQAKQQAYRDIAEQISVQINSQSISKTHKNNVAVDRDWQEHIESASNAQLNDVSLACLDRQDPSGHIHLALRYDGRPLANQLAERIVAQLGFKPRRLSLRGSRSLIDSDLLNATRGQLESLNGQQDAQLDISINQRGNHWQIMVGDSVAEVREEQLSYVVNWSALTQGELEFNAFDNQENLLDAQLHLTEETEYRWQISAPHSGFLHLIGIYQDGSFDVIREDIAINGPSRHRIPEGDGIFESGLIAPDKITTDVYIAVWTKSRLSKSHLAGLLSSPKLGPHHSLNRFLLAMEQLPPLTESAVAARTMVISPNQ